MRASLRGRDELVVRVQGALALATKKEAEQVVNIVINGLEATLLNNLGTHGFSLKLGSFGKFSVRHKPSISRRIPFTGETIQTKARRTADSCDGKGGEATRSERAGRACHAIAVVYR
jgi:nucleoid DNA-binding protein